MMGVGADADAAVVIDVDAGVDIDVDVGMEVDGQPREVAALRGLFL
jgi:hypothetical protein